MTKYIEKLRKLHSKSEHEPMRKLIPDYISASLNQLKPQGPPQYKLDPSLDYTYDPLESPILFHHKYEYWLGCLSNDLNLLLYGPGSKYSVLYDFKHTLEKEKRISTIVAEAYSPKFLLKNLLIEILSHFQREINTTERIESLFTQTLQVLSSVSKHIYIFIHNLEFQVDSQDILSRLANHPNIRMVASLDSPYLLMNRSSETRQRFNFIYDIAPTFAPYSIEKPARLKVLGRV